LKTVTEDSRNDTYYTKLADTWWDKDGPLWPIHTLNEIRTRYLTRWMLRHFELNDKAKQPLSGIKILDVGCGGGVLSESMARLGASVTGIDIVERNIHVAHHHAQQQGLNINYKVSTVEALLQDGDHFDVLLNMEVVEHVTHLNNFMQSCNQLIRPGGLMFIATINRTLLAWFTAIIGAEYILRWLPRGTHQWHKFRKPQELDNYLQQGGLNILDCMGVQVNPLNRRMRLSHFTSINYMLVAQKMAPRATNDGMRN
jgi:2-polyprenyl-6-hydroxyphenyl methylase/3-demethylubiquinone-9 3-methyltransferase